MKISFSLLYSTVAAQQARIRTEINWPIYDVKLLNRTSREVQFTCFAQAIDVCIIPVGVLHVVLSVICLFLLCFVIFSELLCNELTISVRHKITLNIQLGLRVICKPSSWRVDYTALFPITFLCIFNSNFDLLCRVV